MTLTAIVLAVAALIGRGTPSTEVVEAIVSATETPQEAALMTLYAALESDYRHDAKGDGGKSCGEWQQQCVRVADLTTRQRAKLWIYDVLHFGLAEVDSSPARAAQRLARANDLLAVAVSRQR